MKNHRASRRKEILKIRAEINAKEKKETTAKINKTKAKTMVKLTNDPKVLPMIFIKVFKVVQLLANLNTLANLKVLKTEIDPKFDNTPSNKLTVTIILSKIFHESWK